jgi:hypothetical protein
MRSHRETIQALLEGTFGSSELTIRYGGSKAKNTMVKLGYDLDIVAYFHRDSNAAGSTLREIYHTVDQVLSEQYFVHPKTSALRLHALDDGRRGGDLQIDVVPGRYIDGDNGDCFLYYAKAEKECLKTNLQKHIDHVRDSGVVDALKLLKITRILYRVDIKQFALDLLGVDLLAGRSSWPLDDQLQHLLRAIVEAPTPPPITDPANPGNDVSELLAPPRWAELREVAVQLLREAKTTDWTRLLGDAATFAPTSPAIVRTAARAANVSTMPWAT